jgi:alanyl-tRNA synthetase
MGRDLDVYSSLNPSINTEFSGYMDTIGGGKVTVIVKDGETVENASTGDEVSVILDSTSFYAEMGGQVGDSGIIENENLKIEVSICKKTANGKVIHIGSITDGGVSLGDSVKTIVDRQKRMDIARNHTATHLLHAALKQVLGSHVEQEVHWLTKAG